MMGQSKYTDDQMREAVRTSNTIHEALIKLGSVGKGAAYKQFRKKAKEIGLDIQHLTRKALKGELDRISDEAIIEAVKNHISYEAMIHSFGLKAYGTTNRWIRSKIEQLGCDVSHLLGQGHTKGKSWAFTPTKPLEEILVEDSTFLTTSRLKRRLLKAGLLEDRCYNCGIKEWMDNPLSLHLDHINGENTDNRLANLRLLCPNCHSQTSTYCRGKASLIIQETDDEAYLVPRSVIPKQLKPPKEPQLRPPVMCKGDGCGKMLKQSPTGYCASCHNKHFAKPHPEKIIWPDKDTLNKFIWSKPMRDLAKDLGVSDTAIRKRCRKYGIGWPTAGYWLSNASKIK
jgi:hypothetical protein